MKKLYFFLHVCILSLCSYGQNTYSFVEYLNKYEWCSLPISTDSIIKKYSDVGTGISTKEFNTFIKDDIGDFWRYQLFAENKKHFFEYIPTCKFKISEEIIGLLCCCFYYDEDITKERVEVILFIYDKARKISFMSIAGSRFDNFVSDIVFDEIRYRATIGIDKNIEIIYSIYSGNNIKEKIIKKYYHITDEGDILENKSKFNPKFNK